MILNANFIILSTVSWNIWKHRNEVIFNNYTIKTARTLILQIKSCCLHWASNMTKRIKNVVGDWLPVVEDAIPLNQISLMEIVVYQPAEETRGVGPEVP